jgi:PAS domain-containing protein
MDGPARGGEVTLSKKQADDHQGSLRAYAEARLAKGAPARALTPADLLHEFQVHKIELKRQNEELRGAQAALEVARDRYQGLYDFAPVGYFSVGVNGLVEEVNLTGAAMLGEERGKVLGRRLAAFVAPEDGDRWALAFRSIVERDEKQTCEVRLRRKGLRFASRSPTSPSASEQRRFSPSWRSRSSREAAIASSATWPASWPGSSTWTSSASTDWRATA